MANYNVDIAVVIKGNEKLTAFSKQTDALGLKIKQLNDFLKNFQANGDGLVKSLNSLNSVLAETKKNFNAVASGTKEEITAARQLVTAEKSLNNELQRKNGLLEKIRGNQMSAIDKSIARNKRRRPKRDPRSGFRDFSEAADDFRFQGQSSLLPPRSPLPPRSSLDPDL